MEKDELIQIVKELHQEALHAASYLSIMKQYRIAREKYAEAACLSPAFYAFVYTALQKACIMEVAKLFEKDGSAAGMGFVLDRCRENPDWFPEYRKSIEISDGEDKLIHKIPYRRHLKPSEERFFEKEVEIQRIFQKIMGCEDSQICVNLTFVQLLELYQKNISALSKTITSIREQRNKIYAHNDKNGLLKVDQIMKKNPISYDDLGNLIELALDILGVVHEVLTGKGLPSKYSNIDDWDITLQMVELGLKYKEYDLQKTQEERERKRFEEIAVDSND